jgi:hypothetical protein
MFLFNQQGHGAHERLQRQFVPFTKRLMPFLEVDDIEVYKQCDRFATELEIRQ